MYYLGSVVWGFAKRLELKCLEAWKLQLHISERETDTVALFCSDLVVLVEVEKHVMLCEQTSIFHSCLWDYKKRCDSGLSLMLFHDQ